MSLLDDLLPVGSAAAGEPDYYAPLRENDYARCIPLLKEAIRRDDARAMAVYATLLAFGRGIEMDMEDAAAWFRQSAVRGNAHGAAAIGACLATGMGVAIDRKESAYWLWRATRKGVAWGAELLSDLILADQSVVGEHFTMEEFYAAYAGARRPIAKHALH